MDCIYSLFPEYLITLSYSSLFSPLISDKQASRNVVL